MPNEICTDEATGAPEVGNSRLIEPLGVEPCDGCHIPPVDCKGLAYCRPCDANWYAGFNAGRDPAGNRWQPIGTAPHDQRLLLWNGTGMYCGHWAKSIETDDEAWIIAEYGNEGDQLLIKATHWMPLPAPPNP